MYIGSHPPLCAIVDVIFVGPLLGRVRPRPTFLSVPLPPSEEKRYPGNFFFNFNITFIKSGRERGDHGECVVCDNLIWPHREVNA